MSPIDALADQKASSNPPKALLLNRWSISSEQPEQYFQTTGAVLLNDWSNALECLEQCSVGYRAMLRKVRSSAL